MLALPYLRRPTARVCSMGIGVQMMLGVGRWLLTSMRVGGVCGGRFYGGWGLVCMCSRVHYVDTGNERLGRRAQGRNAWEWWL